jgi:hypothetical protein
MFFPIWNVWIKKNLATLPGACKEDAAGDEEEGRRNKEEDEEEPLRLVHVEPQNHELLKLATLVVFSSKFKG